MNILITGSNGQLGTEMRTLSAEHPKHQYFFTDVLPAEGVQNLDITDREAVSAFVQANAIDLIVNCAAYTNVDKAESEPELARKINVNGPANLAKLAAAKNIPLVHISTDYIFDGTAHTPIAEDAPARPLSVYGQTKYEGEQSVLKLAKTAVILRTAWLHSPYGKNFVKTILQLGAQRSELNVVTDQFGTPTYAPHLAQAIVDILPLIQTGSREIYHFTDEGTASWYDFAYYTLKCAHCTCRVLPIHTADYPTPTKRPAFGVLDKTKFKTTFHKSLPHWTTGVELCLKKLS